ncbi:hypothetical protein SAMN02910456_00146 [Ruminococcaceae bacterium YRB3002]|nr:hypothetical protein SAMN02910456_00146 [Ruminococcaceae bacterium YRB3002]
MKTRSNIAIIGFYHLHLLLVQAVCICCTFVEFAFARPAGEARYYSDVRVNMFAMLIGLALFAGAYYVIWELFLSKDWADLRSNKAGPGWYVWMSGISLATMFAYMIIFLIILGLWYDLPDFTPLNSGDVFLITIGYTVLMPVARLVLGRLKASKK